MYVYRMLAEKFKARNSSYNSDSVYQKTLCLYIISRLTSFKNVYGRSSCLRFEMINNILCFGTSKKKKHYFGHDRSNTVKYVMIYIVYLKTVQNECLDLEKDV